MLAIAGPAAAKTHAELSDAPVVTSAKEGVDAATLLSADAAKDALKARMQWADACADVGNGETLAYDAVLDVDASGAVILVTRGAATVTPEAAGCIDGVLKEVKFPPLGAADGAVKVAVKMRLEGREAAIVPPPAPPAPQTAKIAEQAPATARSEAQAQADGSTEADAAKTETEDAKPWTVRASFNLSAGSGLFVLNADPVAPRADPSLQLPGVGTGTGRYVGYSLTLGASYKFTDLLTGSVNFAADQQLTDTNQDTGDSARQFYFRETSIALATTGLWKDEQYTGIGVDVSGRVYLPTEIFAIQANRVMAFGAGVSLKRSFKDVGPGTIALSYGLSVRANVGGAQKDFNPTRNPRQLGDVTEGLGGVNTMSSVANRFSASYSFLDDFTVGLDFGISNAFQRDADPGLGIRESNFSTPGGGQSDLASTSLYLAYQINDMIGLSGGLATASDPVIFDGTSYKLRFPFWDFSESENNLSTVFLTVDFSY